MALRIGLGSSNFRELREKRLTSLANKHRSLLPSWAETSGNDLIREILLTRGLSAELEALLRGEVIDKDDGTRVHGRRLES